MSIREDRSLSQSERFRLHLHLGVCSLCRNYLQHTSVIVKSLKSLIGSKTNNLSEQKKNEIREMLNNEKSSGRNED